MALTTEQATTGQQSVKSYRAAVVHDLGQPLAIEQVKPPALNQGQIRVKVEACGLCHTDIHAAHGDWPIKPTPPFTPGHEGVGTVTKTRVIREVRGLETVNESIADVEAGRVTARVVFEM